MKYNQYLSSVAYITPSSHVSSLQYLLTKLLAKVNVEKFKFRLGLKHSGALRSASDRGPNQDLLMEPFQLFLHWVVVLFWFISEKEMPRTRLSSNLNNNCILETRGQIEVYLPVGWVSPRGKRSKKKGKDEKLVGLKNGYPNAWW